jgi:2-polyprenyl-3-methyl-5-hydroxy-6-metoxy-1,4-benzoquinol methylase
MNPKEHWENIFSSKKTEEMSWSQVDAGRSVELIGLSGIGRDARIIDVGSGESVLIGQLIKLGFSNFTVLDISESAIARSKEKVGSSGKSIRWIASDILSAQLNSDYFDLWHDRAVFHFLTEPQQRTSYVTQLKKALKPDGFAIIATFSLSGPEKCSGLPVMRYSCESLQSEFRDIGFELVKCVEETHATPWGKPQDFVYNLFRRM